MKRTVRSSSALQHTEAWRDDSQRRFAAACRSRWEGLIAKRADDKSPAEVVRERPQ